MQFDWIKLAEILKSGGAIMIRDHRNKTLPVVTDDITDSANEWAAVLTLSGFGDGLYEIQAKIENEIGHDQRLKDVWIRFIDSEDIDSFQESI